MKIGLSSGYRETYWGPWDAATQLGGSENIVVQLAREFAKLGHEVVLRLPYKAEEQVREGVLWVGDDARSRDFDLLFNFDDFDRKDVGVRNVLVACRSDAPKHDDFDQLIFLSAHHARVMGHPGRPHVGGGVHLADYALDRPRLPRRVICCSSPDRCPSAATIGKPFSFVHSYKKVPGFDTVELDRQGLIELQQTAKVGIYPYSPSRESDFFSMSSLEILAAGTPLVISDGPSLVELWGDAAIVLDRPTDLGLWYETVESLLENPRKWRAQSVKGRERAAFFDWTLVAQRYLAAAQ